MWHVYIHIIAQLHTEHPTKSSRPSSNTYGAGGLRIHVYIWCMNFYHWQPCTFLLTGISQQELLSVHSVHTAHQVLTGNPLSCRKHTCVQYCDTEEKFIFLTLVLLKQDHFSRAWQNCCTKSASVENDCARHATHVTVTIFWCTSSCSYYTHASLKSNRQARQMILQINRFSCSVIQTTLTHAAEGRHHYSTIAVCVTPQQ